MLLILIARIKIVNRISKAILTFYLIYCGIWFLISSMNPYGLYNVSNSVYFIQFLGILLFAVGFLFCGGMKTNNNLMFNKEDPFNIERYKSFPIILITLVLILTFYLIKYYSIIAISVSIGDARMERFMIGELFSTWMELFFFNFVISVIATFCLVLIANSIINEKRFNLTFYLSIIYVFIYSLIGSGRGIIIDMFIFIILAYKINLEIKYEKTDLIIKRVKLFKKIIKFILISLFCVIAILALSYMTALRLNFTEINYDNLLYGFNKLIEATVVYFVGPFRAFEIALNNNYIGTTGFLLGRGTFAGIDELLGLPLLYWGINYNYANNIIGSILQNNFINIGPDQFFNYAYTHLMIYYFDFGISGIILFSFLFGYFVRKCINYFQNNPNFFSLAIILFLLKAMVVSVFSWALQSPAAIIYLVSAYYFSQKCKSRNCDFSNVPSK